jgi:adenine-specific DNA-methyltransferase
LLCNPKGRSQDKYFSTTHEYCLVYSKTPLPAGSFSVTKHDELIDKEYKLVDQDGRYRELELRNTHREFNRTNRKNLFYPFFINPNDKKVSLEKTDEFTVEVLPLWPDGFEGCWTWGKDLAKLDNHLLIAKKNKNNWKVYRKSYSQTSEGDNVKKKLFTIWNNPLFYTEKGQAEFGSIFPGLNKNDFPQPKSVELIKEIFNSSTDKDSVILDSFAGSGTSAQALLELNKEDGGNRKFLLIEMANYADSITSERIKRIVNGFNDNEGTGGQFDYYQLGEPLFKEDGELNESISVEKLRNYIYYTETNQPLTAFEHTDNPYLLNVFNQTGYYFYYEPEALTTLNDAFLSTIKVKAEQYIIYADNCLLNAGYMKKNNIIFKKIPRDISKF